MPAKCTAAGEYAQSLLQLIFNATPFVNFAANATVAPLTNLFVSLHTATLTGATTVQTTSEAAYTGYGRVACPRGTGTPGFSVSTNTVSPNATIIFPQATAGSETEIAWGIGSAPSGSGATVSIGVSGGTITAASLGGAGTGYPASAVFNLNVTGGNGTNGVVAVTSGVAGTVTAVTAAPIVAGTSYTATAAASTSVGVHHLLYFGTISPTIVVSNGVQPELTTGTNITEV